MYVTLKAFLPAVVLAILIAWVSTVGGVNLPQASFKLWEPDKIGHLVAYGVLAAAILWGWHRLGRLDNRHQWLTLAFCSLYGIVWEVVQFTYFPGRYFEVNDIIANIIGSTGSLLLIRFFNT